MKAKIIYLTMVLMMVLAMVVIAQASPALAATLNVPSQYLTIQEAVNAATAGDTIVVAAGTYNENVTIDKSLTLQGANAGISAGANPGTRGTESIVKGGFKLTAANINIDGFQIEGGDLGSGDTFNGIYILANYGGHTISNNKFPGPGTSTGRGILFGYSISNTTVKNNEINNWLSGVYINPSSNLLFDGNYFHGNTAGIGSDGISNITVQNNNFTGNTEGWGASTVGANVQAHNNNFVGNVEAIHNYGGQVIDATSNWWGDPTGPYDPSDDTASGGWYNPSGMGDPVSDLVKYDPYLTEEAGGGVGGGCFIATAAYGSYLDSHVQTLRDFRDKYMVTNSVGSMLISAYYRLSPPIAEFIDDHHSVKQIVRVGLLPAVALSTVAVSTTLTEKLAIAGSLAVVSALIVVWLRRRTA